MRRLAKIPTAVSKIPNPLFGDLPSAGAYKSVESKQSSAIPKSPRSTPFLVWRAAVSGEGSLLHNSSTGPVLPSICFVSPGLNFCSLKNAGVSIEAGKAQWIVYFDMGPEYRRASILRVSTRARHGALGSYYTV